MAGLPMKTMNKLHRLQRGISMTEALVALVVLSVGMLGVAGLFVESLRANRSATSRMHAVNLANDMADRILANRHAGNAYVLLKGMLPAAKGCVLTNNCTTENLAQDDLAAWVRQVRAVMPPDPEGDPAETIVDVTAGGSASAPWRYRITIRWTEPGEALPFSYTNVVVVTPGTNEIAP
jgi:type IV pilus assembly protein PilV